MSLAMMCNNRTELLLFIYYMSLATMCNNRTKLLLSIYSTCL